MDLKYVRELLVLKEWTRAKLAEKLGIHPNTVARWFVEEGRHGKRSPSAEQVETMKAWLEDARLENIKRWSREMQRPVAV